MSGGAPRTEQQIFSDLAALCAAPGYAHAIAFFSYRDNVLKFSGELLPKDMEPLFSDEHLIRTEISTLVGLLIKNTVDLQVPPGDILARYIENTESLLKEIHGVLSAEFFSVAASEKAAKSTRRSPLSHGSVLREPIFYGGESAYSFQYRDLAAQRYAHDFDWIKTRKHFSVGLSIDIIRALVSVQERQMSELIRSLHPNNTESWTLLPALTFTADAVAAEGDLDRNEVLAFFDAFTLTDQKNDSFNALSDFNIANAFPLVRLDESTLVLFQYYSLVEALYDSPFYWMAADKEYAPTAFEHRGRFTEDFSTERLAVVFDTNHTFKNVEIYESAKHRAGEIDALVLFADRAIVVQAKSKRLTLESRKGNDQTIRDDFKKSVQDAYDQALSCAQLLLRPDTTLFDRAKQDAVEKPKLLKEIYILCVVSDHYPALNFQVGEFLNSTRTDVIQPPLVLDVFALDAITEMLSSPLHLLSYIKRRVNYSDKLFSGHELTILSYHLKRNLWIDDKYSRFILGEDISIDLDIAMGVRRENLPGRATPQGILTLLPETTLGTLVERIESKPDPATLDLGLVLLGLGGEAVHKLSGGIDRITKLANRDGRHHDISVGIETGTGLTIHCNDDPSWISGPRLESHCERRKYLGKANAWHGICLDPRDGSLRFGVNLEFPWKQDNRLEAEVEEVSRAVPPSKLGRNDPCPCGSGKKYKKCCLNDD